MSAQNAAWRRQSPQRPNNQQRGPHSRDRSAGASGYNTPTSKQDQGMSNYSGNAWGQKGRGGGQGGAGQRASAPPAGPQGYQEEHIPVKGFNSKEAKYTLKKWYQDANKVGSGDGKSVLYKPQGDVTMRSGGVWGSKPNTMANGQDFWVQLRKQVSAFDSGKAT
ncbi:uncharacterized protein K452DRAFT_318353 [Aplosporella prunicola CBS 121167]|uniref:Uncharacterized protein n=1 Tax=Aplosporella prunicola CBS 121167 TaxID=1176127 RepID=A0A6A6BFM2_9PEZI|nr:uncharacterized protein K452DRAFT_318353 [Aplosporella prunicola CBS 121167]KAF2142034.1 hypothetical protein K452DRAFT_318353 [Aplosporella prunicola CBS 121167]